MPEVFRLVGYSFFFYSREHEPLHIHVEGNDEDKEDLGNIVENGRFTEAQV